MSECVHCGGSGILNVIATMPIADGAHTAGDLARVNWMDTPRAVSCHVCEMGNVMAEAGVDG